MQKKELPPDEFDEVVISDLDSGKNVKHISLGPQIPHFKIGARPLEILVAVPLIIVLVIAIPRLQTSTQFGSYPVTHGPALANGHILFTTSDSSALSSDTGSATYSEIDALTWSFDSQHLFFVTNNATAYNLPTNGTVIYTTFFDGPSTLTNHSYDIATGRLSTQNTQTLPIGQYYPLNLRIYNRQSDTSYANTARYIFYVDGQHSAFPADGTLYTSVVMLDRVTGQATEIWREAVEDSIGASLCSATASDDGRYIVLCGKDGMIHIWDATIGQEVQSFSSPDQKRPWVARWSSDDQRLVLSTSVGGVILNAMTGQVIRTLPVRQHSYFMWSPDNNRLLSLSLYRDDQPSLNDIMEFWDPVTGNRINRLSQALFYSPFWLPNDRDILLLDKNEIQTWNSQTGQIIARVPFQQILTTSQRSSSDMRLSPDGRLLAVTGADGETVHVWSTTTGREMYTFHNDDDHTSLRSGIYWSPDSQYIATARLDGTVVVWNARIGSPAYQYDLHIDRFHTNLSRLASPFLDIYLFWSPNGRMVVVQAGRLLALLQAP